MQMSAAGIDIVVTSTDNKRVNLFMVHIMVL